VLGAGTAVNFLCMNVWRGHSLVILDVVEQDEGGSVLVILQSTQLLPRTFGDHANPRGGCDALLAPLVSGDVTKYLSEGCVVRQLVSNRFHEQLGLRVRIRDYDYELLPLKQYAVQHIDEG